MTKSRRRSKSDVTTIDFDNIDIHDVKYLPPNFDGDVLFNLLLMNMGVYSTYSCSMDDIDKMCDT